MATNRIDIGPSVGLSLECLGIEPQFTEALYPAVKALMPLGVNALAFDDETGEFTCRIEAPNGTLLYEIGLFDDGPGGVKAGRLGNHLDLPRVRQALAR
jgi:hypothetical protein